MKTVSFAAAHAVTNGIKTSIASQATPALYSGVALNGSIGAAVMVPERTISVTTAAHAASYVAGSAIVITGTDHNDRVQTETLLLVAAGGGETIVGVKGFKTVVSIAVDAQADALGAFTFGVQDLVIPGGLLQIRALAAGDLHVGYADGTTDTIKALAAKEYCPISPTKIFGDATTTVVGMTLFYK